MSEQPQETQKMGTPTGHALTHEEYVQLEIARLRMDRIKARLWDLERFAESVASQIQQIQAAVEQQPQVDQLQQQFGEARNNHNALTQELNAAVQDMNEKLSVVLEPYNLANKRILVEETEPHEIRVL